ncbi:hypothetical protein ACOMHN_010862 [Nucella lapillus]
MTTRIPVSTETGEGSPLAGGALPERQKRIWKEMEADMDRRRREWEEEMDKMRQQFLLLRPHADALGLEQGGDLPQGGDLTSGDLPQGGDGPRGLQAPGTGGLSGQSLEEGQREREERGEGEGEGQGKEPQGSVTSERTPAGEDWQRLVVKDEEGRPVFRVVFDVREYRPEEVCVRMAGHSVSVRAQQQQARQAGSSIRRQYSREVSLPRHLHPLALQCLMGSDGMLTVEAPLPPAAHAALQDLTTPPAGHTHPPASFASAPTSSPPLLQSSSSSATSSSSYHASCQSPGAQPAPYLPQHTQTGLPPSQPVLPPSHPVLPPYQPPQAHPASVPYPRPDPLLPPGLKAASGPGHNCQPAFPNPAPSNPNPGLSDPAPSNPNLSNPNSAFSNPNLAFSATTSGFPSASAPSPQPPTMPPAFTSSSQVYQENSSPALSAFSAARPFPSLSDLEAGPERGSAVNGTAGSGTSSPHDFGDPELEDPEKFRLEVDIEDFRPEELTVKTHERRVVVSACRQEKVGNRSSSRQMSREHTLPEAVDPLTIKAFFTDGGKLVIEAPLSQPGLLPHLSGR